MGTGVKAATKGLQSIHETLEEAELRDRLCVMGQVGEPTVRAPFLLIFSFLLLLLIFFTFQKFFEMNHFLLVKDQRKNNQNKQREYRNRTKADSMETEF